MPTDARTDPRGRTVTHLPTTGAVLVRSAAPPALPTDAVVDVRPGPWASFDGDRLRLPLVVTTPAGRERIDRRALRALESAVGDALGGDTAVRFGDRRRLDRGLPAAGLGAIERRLAAAAEGAAAPMVTWTSVPADEAATGIEYEAVLR